jgi:hypothetical protein
LKSSFPLHPKLEANFLFICSLGQNILRAILNARSSEIQSEDQNERSEEDESSDELARLLPHIWHVAIEEKGKYCVFLKRMNGVISACEPVGPNHIELTVTASLDENELHELASVLRLNVDTVRRYFPPQIETYHIKTQTQIVTKGEQVINDSQITCVVFPIKQDNKILM